VLIAANGLPLPPPEKPPVPARCPPLDPGGLVEQTPAGLRLPRVDANGCLPWLAHAAAYDQRDSRPRVGVVVLGLGRDAQLTQRAIDGLPARISLAFTADAPRLERWIERARAAGHEALVMLPVQPSDRLPDSFVPSLRFDLATTENQRRLQSVLARAGTGYVGVVIPGPSQLSATETALRPLLAEIAERGLLVLETFRTGPTTFQLSKELALAYATDSGWIDRKADPAEILSGLQAIETATRQKGLALAVGTAQRETIERLVEWSRDVEARGLALTPLSGLVECTDLCAERVRKATGGVR
jgi:polysaccharide deacetylase 2 family uncharacterized protein YibQ